MTFELLRRAAIALDVDGSDGDPELRALLDEIDEELEGPGSLSDIVAAREAIRGLVEPLKLECHGYQVKELLGRAEGDGWLDDDIRVYVEVKISAGEDYPDLQYEDSTWDFTGIGKAREDAMEALLGGIEGRLAGWQKVLDDDVELSGRVGGRCRAVKADSYTLTDNLRAVYEAGGDVAEAIREATRSLAAGSLMDVIAHSPGKVRLRRDNGDEWWEHHWKFTNYLTNASGGRIPDPYYEWVGEP